jgi:hypothetical protein
MTPQVCDKKFEQAEAAFTSAAKKLQTAVNECILVAVRKLMTIANLFDDSDVARLRNRLRLGIAEKNLPLIEDAVCTFIDGHNMLMVDFGSRRPKPMFLAAILALRDALQSRELTAQTDDRAYRDTVRCRANLEDLDKFRNG